MRWVLFSWFLMISFGLTAQASKTDSIKTEYQPSTEDSTKKKLITSEYLFGFDSRNSFVVDKKDNYYKASIFGLRLGIEFNKRIRTGFGFYMAQPPVSINNYKNKGVDYRIKFKYFSYFIDLVIVKKGRWEFSIPMVIGYGNASLLKREKNEDQFELKKAGFIGLGELALVGHFKIFRWLGLIGSIGYRNVVKSDEVLFKKGLDAPIWVASVEFFVWEIYDMIFKRKKDKTK